MSSFYDPGNYDAPSYNAGFDDGVMKGYDSSPEHTIAECRQAVEDHVGQSLDLHHTHEWQPAGVTNAPYNVDVTYVWGMCKCGEIILRQWDT